MGMGGQVIIFSGQIRKRNCTRMAEFSFENSKLAIRLKVAYFLFDLLYYYRKFKARHLDVVAVD
jgi:hypothetical protein